MTRRDRPLWATPVLRSTGLPADWEGWSEKKRNNYVTALAFDAPPRSQVEVIEDMELRKKDKV